MAEYKDAHNEPLESIDNGIQDVFCGSVAGAVGKIIEYPFDTVKVRLQSQPNISPPQFGGPLDCFQQSFRSEGFSGLYRGVSSPIVGAATETASLFLVYNWAQRNVISHLDIGHIYASFLSGAISGVCTSFVLTPIELIKCKIQVEAMPFINKSGQRPSKRPSILATIASVYKQRTGGGIAGFWKGQTGTLFRECGGSSAWFGSHEAVSQYFKDKNGSDTLTLPQSLLSGAIAGISYNLSLFPADTIKSRIQTIPELAGENFWSVGRSVYRHGGIPALYRGCGITLLRAIPSSALIFMTYDKLKSII